MTDREQLAARIEAAGGPDARRLLYLEAPQRQGGHSGRGQEIAKALRIPFPITMANLEVAAEAEGLDPAELWPWYIGMKAKRAAIRAGGA